MLIRSLHLQIRVVILALLCLCFLRVPDARAAQVSVEGRRIFVNGQVFQARGVCYSPTPIGRAGSEPPYGDYYTAEYGAIHARDLPLMRQMGVNCLRVYGWDPAADHSAFLDAAYNNGQRPIYVLVNSWINPATDWSNQAAVNQIAWAWVARATNAMQHPALLGYLLGNELNWTGSNRTDPDFWSALNRVAGAIRQYDTNHLISTALADVDIGGTLKAVDGSMTNFNVWCLQAYRGKSFGMLFREHGTASSKPMLVTEFGMDAYDLRTSAEYADNGKEQADYIVSLWNDILANGHIASGGFVFEWADEWWKAGNNAIHNEGGWAGGQFPDGYADEEWWGIFRVLKGAPGEVDVVQPRAVANELKALWTARLSLVPVSSGVAEVWVEGGMGERAVLQMAPGVTASVWVPVLTNTVPFTNSIGVSPAGPAFYRVELK